MTKKNILFRTLVALTLTVSCFFVLGCKEESKKQDAAAQQQAAPVPMKVVKSEQRAMPLWGEFVGQISAVKTVDVRARVGGFLLEKKFQEGGNVKKGELLYIIDPKPFQEDLNQAKSQLQYNRALMSKAEKDYQRFSKLLDEGVVSRDEFESYQTDYHTYQAKVEETRAQVENAKIQLGYTKIYSPIDGVIGRQMVDVGNLVGQGENTLLATISSVDPVYTTFNISENDYVQATRNMEVDHTRKKQIKMILADGKEYPHEGHFSMIDRAVDPQTGTLGIRVSFPNPDHMLRPGQYAKVRVLINLIPDAIVVPARGVMDVQGMKSIYVVGQDGTVENRPIKIGFEVDNLVVVEKGLEAGEDVIVDGIRKVRPKMKVKPEVVPMTPTDKADQPAAQDTANKDS